MKKEQASEDARPAGTELVTVPSNSASADGSGRTDVAISAAESSHGGDETAQRAAGGIGLYLHAFRRRWPLAITLGLLCGAVAAAAAWRWTSDRYTAVSLLQISVNEQQLVFQNNNHDSNGAYEIYKGTQAQKLTSDAVLIAALRKPEVANLAIVQNQDDPVRWLAKNLKVDLPPNTEIMKVSLTSTQPDEVAVLVVAVVDAYMKEVVDAEREQHRNRLAELNRLKTEKETEMRNLKTQLKQLADNLGTGDSEALRLKQQIALQTYAEARNELIRVRSELRRSQEDLQFKQAWLKALKSASQSASQQAADLEARIAADPAISKLGELIEEIDARTATAREKVKEPLLSKLLTDNTALRKTYVERMESRKKDLAAKLQKTSVATLDPQIAELEARVQISKDQEKAAIEELEKQRKIAEGFGSSSIDIEMMRSDLQYHEKVLSPIADELERLKVELRSIPRIAVFQRAERPSSPDGRTHVTTTAAAGFGGLFGVGFLVLLWDVRKQRINSMGDLSRGLGLTVVGTVPLLPQKMLRTARPSKQHRRWQSSLDHAVDSIVARLFLRKEGGGARVVMVSSATQGEGKTTLAVQLATRLARTGAATLLVDCDLRRPAVHRIFGMPRGPGFIDCLNKELDLSQVVRATDAENLSIITAGNSMPDLLGPLANGVTTSFFKQARAAFTFVVVDGCPLLPVIDGLLISQHSDTVVLSVRRDTSEAPQVLRACEKLVAFGSRNYVVVLNGSQEEVYGEYHDRVISARVEAAQPDKADKTTSQRN